MNEPVPSGGTKLEASILAARQFVQQLTFPGDRAAIVSFNTDATIEQPLTEDREALLAALDRISTSPGTRIDRGIDRGREALTETLADRNRVMILLTDGRSDNVTDEDVLAAADFAKGENILIFTIGLGTNVDPIILQAIASRPEYYYPAPDASQLANIYDAIVYTLPCVNLTWP
jgi:Mg-chelatase subunit ChlD